MPRAFRHGVKRSKYNVDLSALGKLQRTWQGIVFRSLVELRYAHLLDLRRVAGEIVRWEYEPDHLRFEDGVTGKLVLTYTPDFKVWFPDGHWEYHEVKGRPNDAWPIKRRWFAIRYPNITLRIVDKYLRITEVYPRPVHWKSNKNPELIDAPPPRPRRTKTAKSA